MNPLSSYLSRKVGEFQTTVDHLSLKADESFSPEVTPTFRTDRALALDSPAFVSWLEKLQKSSGVTTRSTEDLLTALRQRLDFFHSVE